MEIVKELIEEPDLQIRAKAYSLFEKVIELADNRFEKQITEIIELGIDKGPDFVSASAVKNLLKLAKMNRPVATSILKTLSAHKEWRVRYSICHNIKEIGEEFGRKLFKAFVVKCLSEYLIDQNSETRIGALDALPIASAFMDTETICTKLIPCLKHLVNDAELPVRLIKVN